MEETRWPKAILDMICLNKMDIPWIKRVHVLTDKYGCQDMQVETSETGIKMIRKFEKDVKAKVSKASEEMWRNRMLTKKSLDLYGMYKTTKGVPFNTYRNDRESALLGLARAGRLSTRQHRMHWESALDSTCVKCGMETETTKHVVFECNDVYHSEREYAERLGLTEDYCHKKVTETRKILRKWEEETSQIC